MLPNSYSPALRNFACVTAMATLFLISLGGLVTSREAGMAVPDWPQTYGSNMFFFPFARWQGEIFYEHTHRQAASAVGLLTAILAIWFFGSSARRFLRFGGFTLLIVGAVFILIAPARRHETWLLLGVGAVAAASSFFWPRCLSAPPLMRRLGLIAFVGVVLQGVLGGLRVTLQKDGIGIFHATLAQLFFVLVTILALFTTLSWNRLPVDVEKRANPRWWLVVTSSLIFAQLVLGATMRHEHAGLSIPDFPLAYGKLWPGTDPASIAVYNQQRVEVYGSKPITAVQVQLQMIHRLSAILIFGAVLGCAVVCWRNFGRSHFLSYGTGVWLFLILTQIALGAATIWTGKSPDIATAHVAVGALSLALGSVLSLGAFRIRAAREFSVGERLPQNPSFLPASGIVSRSS